MISEVVLVLCRIRGFDQANVKGKMLCHRVCSKNLIVRTNSKMVQIAGIMRSRWLKDRNYIDQHMAKLTASFEYKFDGNEGGIPMFNHRFVMSVETSGRKRPVLRHQRSEHVHQASLPYVETGSRKAAACET